MKIPAAIVLIILLALPVLANAQSSEADQAYIKAMTATSPAERAQLLKDFIAKFGGKGSQYENFAYANLSLTQYPGKTAKETIESGEKALALGGLDDTTKAQLLIQLSAIYSDQGQNFEKAKSYANQVIELAKAAKAKESDPRAAGQWNMLIGAGTFALGQASEKAKDLRGAIDAYASSYGILKNAQILACIKKIGKELYEVKSYADAEKAFRITYQANKDFESTDFLAKTLYRNGRKDEALTYFKEAYAKQKSGDLAFNIGIILAGNSKTNPAVAPEALRFLLEASFLSPANSQQAMSLAESIYFTSNKDLRYNENVQQMEAINRKIDELTQAYNAKFGGKTEEDLTDAEKTEMKSLLASIETEKKNLEKIQAAQEIVVAQFNKLVEDTKARLGIK